MKKWLIPVIILVVLAFVTYNWAVGFNNTAVEYEARNFSFLARRRSQV